MYKFVEVGFFKKAFGTVGEVRIDVKDQYLDDVFNAKVLFANQKGTFVPYFVQSLNDKGSYVVKVEEIDNPEQAAEISSKICYLREMDVTAGNIRVMDTELDYIIGFDLQNSGASIGKVKALEEYPQQLMAILEYKGKEIMVPMTDAWIIEINTESEVVNMELPDDFLAIFE